MELNGMEIAADKASSTLAVFRDRNLPLFHIQHLAARPDATFFVPDTSGALHHEKVRPLDGETVIQKNYPSSFRETDLEQQLRAANVDELVVVGAMSHMCIDATVRAAFDKGFQCTVLEDACATKDLSFKDNNIPSAQVHGSFMAALSWPYANVIATEAFKPA